MAPPQRASREAHAVVRRSVSELSGRGQPSIRNHDLNRLYASVKVCVGDSLCPGFNHPRYWSDRLPETIGRGGFIIHPRIEGIEEEYGGRVELFGFNDWDTLKLKIDYYLASEDERIRKRNRRTSS